MICRQCSGLNESATIGVQRSSAAAGLKENMAVRFLCHFSKIKQPKQGREVLQLTGGEAPYLPFSEWLKIFQLGTITRKQTVRWLYLSQMKNDSYYSSKNIFGTRDRDRDRDQLRHLALMEPRWTS